MRIVNGEQGGDTRPAIADSIGIAVIELLLDHVTLIPKILDHHQVTCSDTVQDVLMHFDGVMPSHVLGPMDQSQLCLKWVLHGFAVQASKPCS